MPYENSAEVQDPPHKAEPEDNAVSFLRGLAAAFEVSFHRLFKNHARFTEFVVTYSPSQGGYKRGACIKIKRRRSKQRRRRHSCGPI